MIYTSEFIQSLGLTEENFNNPRLFNVSEKKKPGYFTPHSHPHFYSTVKRDLINPNHMKRQDVILRKM
jgi:hypothetical protein